MYRLSGLAIVLPERGAHADQVASGVAVFPLRVSKLNVVPSGRRMNACRFVQLVVTPASSSRDVKVQGVANPGLRMTSPSPELVTTAQFPTVPALNCAAVVSPTTP